jgi:tetratricopeptide (TPR) repeat protein
MYTATGRHPEALVQAKDLERLDPKSAMPYALQGRILLNQEKPREAIEAFNAALRIKPDFPEAFRGLGQAYQAVGQPARAVEAYERALRLNGNDVAALNNLAWILSEVQLVPDKALPLASKAAQLAPTSPDIADTLGWVHYRRGSYAEAAKILVQAAERAPNNATLQYHIGMTYYRLGKKSDAVSYLRRAAQLDPKLAQTERISDVVKELGG